MNKRLLWSFALLLTAGVVYFAGFHKSEVEKLREKHQAFLDNSPYKETQRMSRTERKKLGLPPNAYNEQMWEMKMDPSTGRPMPEKLDKLQQELRVQRLAKGGGGDNFSPWVDRGPNNIGGRTRGIMFDPNDADFNRVFAGGVSGGLWVNEDITDANSSWTLVPGIGANISVTEIVYDPNDTNTFYIGSGESYTSGDAVGRGVWKSTDGGVTWSNIFGGPDGTITNSGQVVNGIFYINDIVVRDVGATSEVYIAVAGALYGSASTPSNFNGANDQGLYKSTDGGANWTRFTINETGGSPSNPNDIELDIDNNIWFTTTRSVFGINGGKIYKSTDGVNFTLEETISSARRTELEPSSTDANKFWVLADRNGQADIFFTDDAFASISALTEPNDVDNGIPATDYARNQAFFNLPVEVDANDNLFVGGIDLFRSTNDGNNWTQISKWSNNNNLAGLNVPLVHADQHAIVFRPGAGNENQAVFGNDGGVYYTPDITAAANAIVIQSRNRDYNVTQFYSGAIDPVDGADGDDIAGGTQDNGTPLVQDAGVNANSFTDFFGGDGAFTDIDDSGQYMIQSYPFNTHRWINYPTVTSAINLTTSGGNNPNGRFINSAGLDKNLDIFYSNASNTTVRIERVAEFEPGGPVQQNTFISDGLMNSEPVAFTVSPFTTTSSRLFLGLRNGRVLRVDNANTTPVFNNISGGGFVGSVSDIEFGQNEQEIFVTFHNYGVTNVWFTDDGGTTWTDIEGDLPDLPVKCILQNPLLPQELIIGTELGVWRTSDYTATNVEWVQSYDGMSDVTVVDLDLRTADNTILATTHGRGMFTSVFTSDVASLDDVVSGEKDFGVYPTISKGDFTIFAKSDLGNSKVNIFDITGKLVYNTNVDFNDRQNQSLSVNLRSGIYIVNILDQNNRTSSEKIIIE